MGIYCWKIGLLGKILGFFNSGSEKSMPTSQLEIDQLNQILTVLNNKISNLTDRIDEKILQIGFYPKSFVFNQVTPLDNVLNYVNCLGEVNSMYAKSIKALNKYDLIIDSFVNVIKGTSSITAKSLNFEELVENVNILQTSYITLSQSVEQIAELVAANDAIISESITNSQLGIPAIFYFFYFQRKKERNFKKTIIVKAKN